MSAIKGLTTFKKKDGILQLAQDVVTWTPAALPNSLPTVTIQVGSIQNLQATPTTSPKVMLKIFVAKEGEQTPESYIFNFTSLDARAEADAIKDALGTAIQAAKAGTAGPGGAPSVTTAATTAGSAGLNDLWSKPRLEVDAELQVSLLKSDSVLSNTFTEAVLSGAVTATQFWSTRTHLLRAHAIERSQARGPYNVLAAIRPTTRMSLSREQIHDIFAQHPLVKTVYDENVPRVSEDQFWSRFFLSRLFKKLKGEKLLPNDPTDNIFDRYLQRDEEENSRKRRKIDHVPLTIDLAGNEQNLSKKKRGNAPDMTMRPSLVENVPIIRTLNSLSQKLVDLVTPEDTDRKDQDERYMDEQRLTDLGGDFEEERIILNIQDQRKFFSNEADDGKPQNRYVGLDPAAVLDNLRKDLGPSRFDIATFLPGGDDDDEDMDGIVPRTTLYMATHQVTEAVRDRTSQLLPSSASNNTLAATGGLPIKVFDQVQSVHATTNEFLHHFWLAFLSGDEKRAKDINNMATSLKNSKERIAAIAKAAEEEKEMERVKRKKDLQEEYKKTGIKPKKKDLEVGGGSKVVGDLMAPTIVAIDKALSKYQAALEEAERSVGGSAVGTPAA